MELIFEYLERIQKASGTNEKKEELRRLLVEDEHAEEFFRLVYDDAKNNVGSRSFEKILDYKPGTLLPKYEDAGEMMYQHSSGTQCLSFAFTKMFMKDVQSLSGNVQQTALLSTFSVSTPQYAKWITRALLKDLRIGITRTSVNEVFQLLGRPIIEKYSVQLCGKLDSIQEWTEFPIIAAVKYDGFRCIATKRGNNIELISRHGKKVDFVPEIVEALKKLPVDCVLDGEIMASNFNEIQKRIGRKEENIVETKDLHYRVFDILEYNYIDFTKDSQLQRRKELRLLFDRLWKDESTRLLLRLEESFDCQTKEELERVYQVACKNGWEGIIIKKLQSPYIFDSRTEWFKVKPVVENSFEVVGTTEGRGKHLGTVGALIVMSKNGIVKANVGSGIDDYLRSVLTDMQKNGTLIGTIVDVQYNEVTSNKEGTRSLRFPRLLKIREDKTEADEVIV